MTHVVKLFGDIVAEQTEKGTYIVRKGEKQVSPYEYETIRQLTPRCWGLFRKEEKRHDLIFSSGAMEFGCQFAYELGRIGRGKGKKSLIGVMFPNGTGIIDDSRNFLAFIPWLHHIRLVEDRFLVAILFTGSEPWTRVYDLYGELLAEGLVSEALQKATSKVECL